MEVLNLINNAMNNIMSIGGINTTITLLSFTFDSGSYDDNVTKSITGSKVVSGLVFPIHSKYGSKEAMLLEQGKLLTKDKVVYTGSVSVSGNILVSIGSDKYSVIPDGVESYDLNGSTIYSKFFIRYSIPGSLF